MKEFSIENFKNNDGEAAIIFNEDTKEVTLYIEVAEFSEEKALSKKEIEDLIEYLTTIKEKI